MPGSSTAGGGAGSGGKMSRAAYASAAGMPSDAAGSTAHSLDVSCSVASRARMAVRA